MFLQYTTMATSDKKLFQVEHQSKQGTRSCKYDHLKLMDFNYERIYDWKLDKTAIHVYRPV